MMTRRDNGKPLETLVSSRLPRTPWRAIISLRWECFAPGMGLLQCSRHVAGSVAGKSPAISAPYPVSATLLRLMCIPSYACTHARARMRQCIYICSSVAEIYKYLKRQAEMLLRCLLHACYTVAGAANPLKMLEKGGNGHAVA
jgi:hypothetical protein